MKNFEVGDLVGLSLHGKMMLGNLIDPERIGIVINTNLRHHDLVLIKWFNTSENIETHIDFIKKLEGK
jgi:hypothetical protein